MAVDKQARLDKLQDAMIGLLLAYEIKLNEAIKELKPKRASLASVAAGLRVVVQANAALRSSVSQAAALKDEDDEEAPLMGLRITG